MSVLVTLVAIAISFLASFGMIDLIDFWHLGWLVPNWLGWLLVVSVLAWLGGDR